MMLIEQSVAPLQFVRLEQSHLQAVQDDLILGAGHPKFFAHAPKLEKSEGACPAKRVYAFPLNYLHSVMDWRWGRPRAPGLFAGAVGDQRNPLAWPEIILVRSWQIVQWILRRH